MRTAFEVEGLFDGQRVIDNAAIVLDGGVVAWMGDRAGIPPSAGAQRTEVGVPARFAMPGMINCHAHLTLDGDASFAIEVRQSDTLATLKAFRNARATLRAGVTSLRDL